jgi:thiosulfate reductase cytochrome b subunit
MNPDKAVRWHNFAAVLLIIGYIGFVAGNILSENGKYYKLEKRDFWKGVVLQLRYYSYGMFKGEKNPFTVTFDRKFNPLQKLSYVLVMYVSLPILIITGIGLLLPDETLDKLYKVKRSGLSDLLHITMGFLISIFLLIHIYTCTLGSKASSLFRGIITGYRDSGDD